MPRLDSTIRPHVALPSGRLLYRRQDAARYVVVQRAGPEELWITLDGFAPAARAAGPFRPADTLRALRLAHTQIPEGCERGPWTDGLTQFDPTNLPGHASDWSALDPQALPPTLSRYHVVDIDGGGGEACCSPPRIPPSVAWTTAHEHDEAASPVPHRTDNTTGVPATTGAKNEFGVWAMTQFPGADDSFGTGGFTWTVVLTVIPRPAALTGVTENVVVVPGATVIAGPMTPIFHM